MMQVDFVVIGAGMMGLSIARELRMQHPYAKIAVVEKESQIGLHASGRNSGVLHAGIYYSSDSLKAKFCLEGARLLRAYCDQHQLPIQRVGKMIVSPRANDESIIQDLYQRALKNGASVELITQDELNYREPHAHTATEHILFSPETSVVDPIKILKHLYDALITKDVAFYFKHHCTEVDLKQRILKINGEKISYHHLFNAAGLHADRVASACGLSNQYSIIPFKGMYYEISPYASFQMNHLIYPVPDMNVPFLGVHFTKSIQGKIYVGPTAIPVLGRENYVGLKGAKLGEAVATFSNLGYLYLANRQGFRQYTHQETPRFIKTCFLSAAKSLVPSLKKEDLIQSQKVGIRAQLFDHKNKNLPMDFVIESTTHETHILNAVSPAFTSAFSFAKYVVNFAV